MPDPTGPRIHDGAVFTPQGCPRGLPCAPYARIASEDFASFFCCGDNHGAAPVPEDRFRFCVKSTHDQSPVDVLINFDRRDVADALYVLAGAVSVSALDEVLASNSEADDHA